MWRGFAIVMVTGLTIFGCARGDQEMQMPDIEIAPDIVDRRAQFVQKSLPVEISSLSAGDREALRHLVEAARVMDEIFKLEALGDYEAAVALVERYGTVHPAMDAAIAGLTDVPVDVEPHYPLEGLQ